MEEDVSMDHIGWQTRHWMVEDVLVNRNMKFSMEIVDEVCRELSTSDAGWSNMRQNRTPLEEVGRMIPETIGIVSCSCLSTSFTCDERRHAGTQYSATE